MAQKTKAHPRKGLEILTDEEVKNIVGGTAGQVQGDGQGGLTPGDYWVMEGQGPADRSEFGPGSGE